MSTSHDLPPRPFLTAEWRYLALLNYAIDPEILQSLVPAGTELDDWQGRTFVSVVGFLFLDTRVLGIPIPFHRNFEEVNLRFYVRLRGPEGWRRAVVFVSELVPRAAIAFAARTIYGEPYLAVPMTHAIELADGSGGQPARVTYAWRFNGRENRIDLRVQGDARALEPGSQEEFIAEHYWGYTRGRDGATREYRVEHAPWRVWTCADVRFDCDVAALYGSQFVDCLRSAPASAYLADGSPVTVFSGRRLQGRPEGLHQF
jgi:uncharacterized protein YqjF (DUF2071 family)